MKQDPVGVWNKTSKKNSTSFQRYITMYYTTSDIATFTSDKLIDFPTFVSATGGNLGLFLGLSFLGILFWFYECMEKVYLMFKKRNSAPTIKVARHESSSFN